MSDIRFNCSACGQHIEAAQELGGQLIDCPTCKQTIEVPFVSRPEPVEPPSSAPPRSEVPPPPPVAPPPRVSQSTEMFSPRHVVGIIGALVLFVGVFAPIVSVPIVGSINYFHNGRGDGAIVLVLALLCLVAVLTKKDVLLFFTSIGCLAVLTFTFANFRLNMAKALAEIGIGDDSLASNLTSLAVQSIQLQWGWAILVVGACLSLAPIFIKSRSVDSSLGEFYKLAAGWRTAAAAAAGLCGGVVIVALLWSGPADSTLAAAPMPKKPLGWHLRRDISPIDDSTMFFLTKEAEEPIGTGFMSSTPRLTIRHQERQLETFVSYGTYLGTEAIDVTVRLGQSPPRQERWHISTDGQGIFYPLNDREFIQRLLKNDRLVLRLTPVAQNPVTVTFDLTGLSNAIQPMKAVVWGQ